MIDSTEKSLDNLVTCAQVRLQWLYAHIKRWLWLRYGSGLNSSANIFVLTIPWLTYTFLYPCPRPSACLSYWRLLVNWLVRMWDFHSISPSIIFLSIQRICGISIYIWYAYACVKQPRKRWENVSRIWLYKNLMGFNLPIIFPQDCAPAAPSESCWKRLGVQNPMPRCRLHGS